MERQIYRELEHIREMIITMGTLAEEAVLHSTRAFFNRDGDLAQSVIGRDHEVNSLEMQVDKAIFEFIALKQPVAADLRFLFSVQKMNKDLERIGDHAVNIAQSAVACLSYGNPVQPQQLQPMTDMTRQMLNEAMTSFIASDAQLALKILEQDDQVDSLNGSITRDVIDMVKKDRLTIEYSFEIIRVSKNLERVADLSTNIAEDVIFHAKARDVKHQHGE